MIIVDVERSARWYEEVLGFVRVGSIGDATTERRKVLLRHRGLDVR
jgi:hypothetical protein